jgi:hypothetical protein
MYTFNRMVVKQGIPILKTIAGNPSQYRIFKPQAF